MAIPMIKATYTLDSETVRALEAMARRLGVSKSEALRRAIRDAVAAGKQDGGREAALDQLQSLVSLTPRVAADWERAVRDERRANDRAERLWGAADTPLAAPLAAPLARRVAERLPKRRR